MKRKFLTSILILSLALSLLCGCSGTVSAESVSILYNGEIVDTVDLTVGDENVILTSEISPDNCSDGITWESDDAGVIKVTDNGDGSCSLSVKKTGIVRISAHCGEAVKTIKVYANKNQDKLAEREIAITVNGVNYSAEKLSLYYADQYYTIKSTLGDWAPYYGLDTSTGLYDLETMNCSSWDDSYANWREYLLDYASQELLQMHVLEEEAARQGLSLDEDEIATIDETINSLCETAAEKGYSSADELCAENYGDGVTVELYRQHLEQSSLAYKVYTAYIDTLSFTDDEIKEHYEELGYTSDDDYDTKVIRTILIPVEESEDGSVTDEAVAEAEAKANDIYDEWISSGATEESFAELADKYSSDSGSSDGGLYEDVCKDTMLDELDEFAFGDRKVGDVEIIYSTSGSSNAYFLIYYAGTGERYSTYVSLTDLQSTAVSSWIQEMVDASTVEYGQAYDQIGYRQ